MFRKNMQRAEADRVSSRFLWSAVVLSFAVATSYLLIEAGLLGIGDLLPEEGSSVIVYVAAACYALGGLLIPLRRRWLWVVGAVMNALVILFFLSLYSERPAVLLSSGGVVSKAAQMALQVTLMYLIVTDWLDKRTARFRRSAAGV